MCVPVPESCESLQALSYLSVRTIVGARPVTFARRRTIAEAHARGVARLTGSASGSSPTWCPFAIAYAPTALPRGLFSSWIHWNNSYPDCWLNLYNLLISWNYSWCNPENRTAPSPCALDWFTSNGETSNSGRLVVASMFHALF